MPVSRNKQRKSKKGIKPKHNVQTKKNDAEPWDTIAVLESLILIRTGLLAISIATISLGLLFIFYLPAMDSPAVNRLPYIIKFSYAHLGVPIYVIVLLLTRAAKKLHLGKRQDRKRARTFVRWMVFLSIVQLTIAIFPSLYVAGFTDYVAGLINTYFPSVGAKTKETISYIATIIISGVIGNLAYDVLKRLVLSRINNRARAERQNNSENATNKRELFK